MTKNFIIGNLNGINPLLIVHKDREANKKMQLTLSRIIFSTFILKEICLQYP